MDAKQNLIIYKLKYTYTHLNTPWSKRKSFFKNEKYLKRSCNKGTTYQNIWHVVKVVLRGKLIAKCPVLKRKKSRPKQSTNKLKNNIINSKQEENNKNKSRN